MSYGLKFWRTSPIPHRTFSISHVAVLFRDLFIMHRHAWRAFLYSSSCSSFLANHGILLLLFLFWLAKTLLNLLIFHLDNLARSASRALDWQHLIAFVHSCFNASWELSFVELSRKRFALWHRLSLYFLFSLSLFLLLFELTHALLYLFMPLSLFDFQLMILDSFKLLFLYLLFPCFLFLLLLLLPRNSALLYALNHI